MDNLKSYRLNSMEEPTDEQLEAIVAEVGEMAKENNQKAQIFLNKKMEDLRLFCMANR